MARKPRSSGANGVVSSPATSAGGQGKYSHTFINVYLSQIDEQWLGENDLSADGFVAENIADLELEYEFTVRQDIRSGKWNAMLKCTGGESGNNGYILSVRASNAFDAIYGLFYAHVVKFNRMWGGSGGEGASRFN